MPGDSAADYRLLDPGADLPMCDSRIAQLYGYWLSLRPPPDLLPARHDMSPADIPRLLPWLWLTEVHRGRRFRYRLVGTIHVDAFGANTTGRWYDDVHPLFRQSTAYPQFIAVAERGKIAFYRGPPVYVIDAQWKTIERLILPLAQNGRDVDMLLGITVLDPKPAAPPDVVRP